MSRTQLIGFSADFLQFHKESRQGMDPVNLMDDDAKIEALKKRIDQAKSEEAVRSGKTQKGVDDNYRLGNRVLADLIAGIGGGALVGWVLDHFIGTSPWLLLVFLFLGIIVAFRNIIKLSNESAKKHK